MSMNFDIAEYWYDLYDFLLENTLHILQQHQTLLDFQQQLFQQQQTLLDNQQQILQLNQTLLDNQRQLMDRLSKSHFQLVLFQAVICGQILELIADLYSRWKLV